MQRPVGSLIFRIMAVGLSLFHIYTALFGILGSTEQRAVHLGLASGLVFIALLSGQKMERRWYDWVLTACAIASAGYVAVNANMISNRMSYVEELTVLQMLLAIIGIVVLLEAGRRTMGLALPTVVMVFLLYAFLGNYIPGKLGHSGFSLMWILDHLYYTPSGVFGVPLGVSSTYVAIFVVFGAILNCSGGGKFFTEFAMAAMGSVRGGPAKIAIVASGLFGMICGAASGNVATTGSVTIPLMTESGYEKHYAGAIEAVAATGGEIMPPIMGAGAFILAQMAGIPYRDLCIAAFIPAMLYYLAVYMAVDLEAIQRNLKGLSKAELPPLMPVLRDGWIYLVAIGFMLYMILKGYTPIKAGGYAIVVNIALCYLRKATRIPLKVLIDGLESAASNLGGVAVACGMAGILVGVMTLTDLGLKLTQMVEILSGGNLLIALLLSMVVAILLGMGMPPSAAYIVEAVLVAPALIKMGLPALSAHLFIFYFTVLSAITPPVAVAAFAAGAICGGNPMKVGWLSMKIALPGMIVPYMFVYAPGLLLEGGLMDIGVDIITAAIGVIAFAIGIAGHIKNKFSLSVRAMFLAAALLLISPWLTAGVAGFIMLAGAVFLYRYYGKKNTIDELTV